MKKNRKRLQKKDIKFRGRMLLIYIIGGIIPFIGVTVFTNYRITDMMLDINKTAQQERVSFMATDLQDSMPVVERVAKKISQDQDLRQVMETKYESRQALRKDYEKYSQVSAYRADYVENISDICIYVNNGTICNEAPFKFLEETVTKTDWYLSTVADPDGMYWGCAEDTQGKYIQLSCILNDSSGKLSGVLTIRLKDTNLLKAMGRQSINTALLLDDDEIIYSNFDLNKNLSFIQKFLHTQSKNHDTQSIKKNVEEYLLSYQKIYPSVSDSYFTLLCVHDFQQGNKEINQIIMDALLIAGMAFLFSVGTIVIYSNFLGARLKKLRRQMHLVATGRYDSIEPVTGKDEIGEIYQELEKMMGDIQELTSTMVEEKVQKEKLHTHQKEVEFKMLASQINPHFLYNTLETIRMKARVNKQDEIEDLVKMLAKIMRRNIQVSNQMVSLQSEVELTENYLKIQDYRFGDRIESDIHVEEDIDLDRKVMPLIIQPFVENAFKHGLEAMSEKGKLTVEICQDENDVIIRISDNGVGMPYYRLGELRHSLKTGETPDRTHIGISNVDQRLKLQYGEEYGVKIESRENAGTKIELRIPKNHNFLGKNV